MARNMVLGSAASGEKGLSASEGPGTCFAALDGAAQLQMFRSLADHSQEFIGMCDLEFKPFYVNEAGMRLVGLDSLEEAGGVRVQDFFFPEDQRFISKEFFPKVLREGAGEVEIRFRHFKTGAAVWMRYFVFQVRDGQGQASGYATLSRDITARKLTEEALRESEQLYRGIIETAGEGIAMHEPDGTITYINQHMARMLGYSREEVVGRSSLDFVDVDDEERERVIRAREKVREKGGFNLERRLRRKDGSVLWTLCNVSARRDGAGNFVGYLAMHTDITERKRVETERQRLVSDLGERVKELTALHGAARLLQAEREFDASMLSELVMLLPPAWQYPEICEARIVCGDVEGRTAGWRETPWQQKVSFATSDGQRGEIAVVYLQERPAAAEGPFLAEERNLIQSLADMLAAYLERKRAEEAVRGSEAGLRGVLESSPDPIFLKDRSSRFLLANAATCAAMGKSAEEIIGKTDLEVYADPIVGRAMMENDRRIMESGQSQVIEEIVPSPEGPRTFLSTKAPYRDADGRIMGTIGVARDITERKRAEQAQARLAAIVEGSDDAIISKTLDGTIQTWNAGAERMFGYRAEEVIGRSVTVLIPPERLGEEERVLAQLRRGEPIKHYETVRLTKDGQRLDVSLMISPVKDSGGRIIGASKIVRDIGDLVRAREVLARDKRELERLVAERTAKLQELVGELEHFSYTITHDLKSPLRAMRSFAEMMSMTCGGCERVQAKEFLGRISTSADRMNHLIADALNYSRSVRQELPLEDVDAGALLRGMLDTYPELQPDKARIVVEGRLPVVLANEAGLTQVFSNLLGNAVKFVKPGEKPDIRVWSGQREGWVRIWVEDKGIGIAKEMLPRVFDMFARGSKVYEGTGIGLALVRKVTQRMGGKVGVESEEGKGSRFWIELRCGEAKESGGQVTLSPGAAEESGTVLYVEDEESDALFMQRAFKEKGLGEKLRVVGDGRAAIDYLSGSGQYSDRAKYPVPALVLLDLNLPHVPGFGVLEWMRNHPDYARTPVVVFSSSTREDDRVKARELGASEFLSKPSSGLKFGEVVEGLQERLKAKD